jgi:hypothetical protein
MVGVRALVPNPTVDLPQRYCSVSLSQACVALEMKSLILMTPLISFILKVDSFILLLYYRLCSVEYTGKPVATSKTAMSAEDVFKWEEVPEQELKEKCSRESRRLKGHDKTKGGKQVNAEVNLGNREQVSFQRCRDKRNQGQFLSKRRGTRQKDII